MRSLKMPEVLRVRFLNPVMENEVKRACLLLTRVLFTSLQEICVPGRPPANRARALTLVRA
jgi:hypothetical protein